MGWPTGRHACRPLPSDLLRREGSAHRISWLGVALTTEEVFEIQWTHAG